MISIVVPTYNRANVIHKSIDSILNQTYKDFELIIVDDGSKDNTEQVVKEYHDDRIKYVRNESEKHGPSSARNIGIKHSTGQYIAFNDSDDEWHQDKLEKQIEFLKKTRADVTFCVMRKNSGGKQEYIPERSFTQDQCNIKRVLISSFTGTPALLGKADCFKNNLFDEAITCNEDWELVIRLIDNYNVVYQSENLVEVSVTQQSVSSDYNNAVVAMQYIMDKHKDLYEIYSKSLKDLRARVNYQIVLCKEADVVKKLQEKNSMLNVIKWIGYRFKRYAYALYFVIFQ